jgi:DNA polymerase elongation subunit (family B)
MNVTKAFRLIDFATFDATLSELRGSNTSSRSGSDAGSDTYPTYEPRVFAIQMFGINEKGETCSITVENYQPFFFAHVGDHWTQYDAIEFVKELCRGQKGLDKQIEPVQLVDYKKLYGFANGKKDKFVQITCKTHSAFNRLKNKWYNDGKLRPIVFGKTRVDIYESSIPPLLRYFHIQQISPSGWIQVQHNRAYKPEEKQTTCTYEYVCSLKHVSPIPGKETRVPYKIMSFDIEASSSHGDFPLPQKSYKKLAQNVVEIYDKQSVSGKDMAALLIRRIVMTAFGFDTFDDVDKVYPKATTCSAVIQNKLNLILATPILSVEKLAEEDRSYLLTIAEAFRRSEEEEEDGESRHYDPKLDKNFTMVDLLLSDKYSRDMKITKIDEVFTHVFPPLKGDEVTFIGSTFLRYGEKEPYLNHCLVVGSCDPVENATIETTETEKELLLKWSELVVQEDPDVIIGYNIFGFDYEFMFRRAQENGCERVFLQLSRKIGEMCGKHAGVREEGVQIEHTTVSLASGEYDLRYFKMSGRIQIDMYTYLRRDFNFASYKLDDMAAYFISDEILSIESFEDGTTGLVSKNLAGLHAGDYIHIEITSFTSDYYAGGKKFQVLGIDIREKDKVIRIPGHHPDLVDKKNIKWTMGKDDVSPQDIFRLSKGTDQEKARVAKYCIQDCNLVHHLMNKVDVLTGYVEMSAICSVPISFLVFRGQGIKLTSYVAKKCREKETLMPDLEKSGENDGYEGAIVLPPKCSMYMDNPVACVDYASLYPSSMISQNFSHDSKVWTKEYDLDKNLCRETGQKDRAGNYVYDNLPDQQYIDIEFDTFEYIKKTPTSKAVKTKSGTKVCRWAQNPKGIMPSILEELLKARSDTRKKAKTEPDPFMQNILDKRQLGYKVTANSLYGQCGAKTSTFYEKDVAACTTATGRMMITYARRIIEEIYGDSEYNTDCHGPVLTKAEYVYGDSVAEYTPVIVRVGGHKVDICQIDELAYKYGVGEWRPCLIPGKDRKEYCVLVGVESWSEKGWTRMTCIIRHALAPYKNMVRVFTKHGIVDVTDDHSLLLKTGREISPKNLPIGTKLMHRACQEYVSEKTEPIFNMRFKNQVDAARAMASLQSKAMFTKYTVCQDVLGGTYGSYSIRPEPLSSRIFEREPRDAVYQLQTIPYVGYVYDLTTDNHHFAAGIGNMIVHNTDSVFFTFNLQDKTTGLPIRGQKALEMTIEIAQDAASLCTRFLKPPMELSYEKTLMPFILLKKKRYVGMLYETNPNKGKLKYMGLSLKRRDSCDYLKDVYGEILNILMKDKGADNIQRSVDYLNTCLQDLIQGKVPMEKLAITRALSSYYKNPQQIAHRVLADRMAKRDPGNKPKSGDRIKYVFFENASAGLQGDKIETPEYVVANGLKLDYTHYITNQLMKPLQQLFGLALEPIWDYQKKGLAIKAFKKELAAIRESCGEDLEEFAKKQDAFVSKKAKEVLFDKWLQKIYNDKNGIQKITSMFSRK